LINKDTYLLGYEMKRITAILIAASGFNPSKTKVTPSKPHGHPLWMVLGGRRYAMSPP
jgi:hypothetical protein